MDLCSIHALSFSVHFNSICCMLFTFTYVTQNITIRLETVTFALMYYINFTEGAAALNVLVHLMFAYHVRKIIKKDIGIKLNLLGYMVGNVLPDIRARFNSQPHYIDASLKYVVKSSQRLINNDERLSRDSYQFSKRMGIINHYLSDFFCYPHQAYYNEGLRRHMTYEFKMLAKYRRGLRRAKRDLIFYPKGLIPEDFESWILRRNRSYRGQQISCATDVSHAIHAGSTIGRSLNLHMKLSPQDT